jgi:hypothetical protein
MEIKFKTSDRGGDTSLQGQVSCSYKGLVRLFGEPNSDGDGYKVSVEWNLEDENGEVVTLYDWKCTSLYDGHGISPEQFKTLKQYDWHIGAENVRAANKLRNYIINNLNRN